MFEKEAKEYLGNFADCANCKERWSVCADSLDEYCLVNGCCYATPKEQDIYIAGAEFGYNRVNEELEQKISVLLSCENCPENKDGLICRKEYENKCLAQKIQYIKELKEENAELKEKLKPENCLKLLAKEGYIKFTSDQLTEAKKVIEELYNIIPASMADYAKEPMEHARKFMTEE